MNDRKIDSLSIYFYAGDFCEVLRRHASGMSQAYGTHTEVAKLIHDLADAGIRTSIYSYCTPERRVERPLEKVRVISLGARSWNEGKTLARAVGEDSSDAIIPHFGNPQMLKAVAHSGKRSMALLASTFFWKSLRFRLRTRRIVALYNRKEFELVANHCLPATELLAELGVRRQKLIPWDVPHPLTPEASEPKRSAPTSPFKVMYAGEITEVKGVGDIIRAIPHLRFASDIKFHFAGRGDVDAMTRLAARLGVADKVEFLGIIPNAEVLERFKSADVLVVPSRWECLEGFPLTMFESISTHTPIVCSDHPIFQRIMADRENVMLYHAGDDQQLARAIDAVLSDPELYLRLSNAAEKTWKKLEGPADWRTLILEWVRNGPSSEWIRSRMLDRQAIAVAPASA